MTYLVSLVLSSFVAQASPGDCSQWLTVVEPTPVEFKGYTVNGAAAPRSSNEWQVYAGQLVNIEFRGPSPYFQLVGVARQRVTSEAALDSHALQRAKYLLSFGYEVAFWQVHTTDGRSYFSEFFTSGLYNQVHVPHAVEVVNQLLRRQGLTLADLAQINLFHNHPQGTSPPLSTGDRAIVFYFSDQIRQMQCYPPICTNSIAVGIYSIHPEAPGVLFYTDTGI